MYNENGVYVAPDALNFSLSFKEKIRELFKTNWKSALLRLFYWNDTYGKHLERYYNLSSVKKSIMSIHSPS